MSEFKLEKRYIVLKTKDVERTLSDDERAFLARIEQKISDARSSAGKDALSGLYIEQDWPEFNPTLSMLKSRVESEFLKDTVESMARGLEWYRDQHPQEWSTADDEILTVANSLTSK